MSNRLEYLSDLLAGVLTPPLSSPLEPEIIMVQSKGMARWVSMALARQHGICANCWFPFPNAFFNYLFKKLDPELPEVSPFDPEKMVWRILSGLKECLTLEEFEPLKSYLGTEATRPEWGLKGFQLARRITDTFDQYLMFRPEMILKWDRGHERHWQAVLWRKLMQGETHPHRASLVRTFLSAVNDRTIAPADLPERVTVFGISALPPYHMTILSALSNLIPVHLFVMNPCREFWGDIVSGREQNHTSRGRTHQGVPAEDLHLERGNSLLASMGTLGRDFFDLLEGSDAQIDEAFVDPLAETSDTDPLPADRNSECLPGADAPRAHGAAPGQADAGNLLLTLQSHILNLIDGETIDPKPPMDPQDTSIQIHSCHSPMREVEVLRDRVLHMFAADRGLQPQDILIMTPDIDTYAPLIEAVFGGPGDETGRMPFSIADQGLTQASDIIDPFFDLLVLPRHRYSAPHVLNILESEAVRRKFGLVDLDMDLIRQWVEETAIRWGIDEQDRENQGFPGFPENSWSAGIKRLLLGYAMPAQEGTLYAGILPYDAVEGGDTLVLGRFVAFIDRLFAHTAGLDMPRPPQGWTGVLNTLLETLFDPDDTMQAEAQSLRETFHHLREMSAVDGRPYEGKITLNGVTAYIRQHLQQGTTDQGFMTAGMTFCRLLPMRSVPRKVICLLGMNSRDYPRETVRIGFDVMAQKPRPGDRSRRNDDRYLFLETLLSARQTLYISYVGQSIQDNSLIPPSVLVSELLDYVEGAFRAPEGEITAIRPRDRMVTVHRLQPFHPDYFRDNKTLFSYSQDLCEAARHLVAPSKPDAPFITIGLSPPEAEFKEITVNDLCAFFAHPAKYLLRKRLHIQLKEETALPEVGEPFELSGLENYHMAQDLLAKRLSGHDLHPLFAVRKAAGRLPHGEVGRHTYETLCRQIEAFSQKTQPYLTQPLAPLDINLEMDGFRVTGRLHSLYTDHRFAYRYALVKVRDRLTLWIQHLILNAVSNTGYPQTSILAGLTKQKKDRVWAAWRYHPMGSEESAAHLKTLLTHYRAGLTRPLHFFPESAYAYVWALRKKGKSRQEALDHARGSWQGRAFSRGERQDPYYRYSFRDTDPLDEQFEKIACEILGPLVADQDIA